MTDSWCVWVPSPLPCTNSLWWFVYRAWEEIRDNYDTTSSVRRGMYTVTNNKCVMCLTWLTHDVYEFTSPFPLAQIVCGYLCILRERRFVIIMIHRVVKGRACTLSQITSESWCVSRDSCCVFTPHPSTMSLWLFVYLTWEEICDNYDTTRSVGRRMYTSTNNKCILMWTSFTNSVYEFTPPSPLHK